MPNDIPPIDSDIESCKTNGKHNKREFEAMEANLLEANAEQRRLAQREIDQRYWLRWIALSVGLAVIGCMACVLYLNLALESSSGTTIVAPIASITAITVALFVAAFRKLEDKDLDAVGSGSTKGAAMLRGE